MAKNLKLLLSFIVAFEADALLPALAQSNQPIGSANTVGSVANSNATFTPSPAGPQSSPSSSSPSSSPPILLPSGRTASPSNSTITVCDDPGAPFPNEIDVCSLR